MSFETSPGRSLRWRVMRIVVVLVVLGGVLWFGRVPSRVCNSFVRGAFLKRDWDRAEKWLVWSSWWYGRNPETDLLWARLWRHRHYGEALSLSLKLAREHGASADDIRREELLVLAQTGEMKSGELSHLRTLDTSP